MMTFKDHCRLQKTLVDRLRMSGYTEIKQNYCYAVTRNNQTYIGEVDVLAFSPHGRWHFYEIKSCSQKVERAREQYQRFRNSHPAYNARGIYVSPKKITYL
jgi:RecB family endonuclease NucS